MSVIALMIANVHVPCVDVVTRVKPFTTYCPSDVQPVLQHTASDHERLEYFRSTLIGWIHQMDGSLGSNIDEHSSDNDVIMLLHTKLGETRPWLSLPLVPPYTDYYYYE